MDATQQPMVNKPVENTPLVKKEEEADAPEHESKICGFKAENVRILLSLSALVIIAVTKVQVTALLFKTSKFPTVYSLWSCIITCILLVPIFLVYPKQWGVPTWEMFKGPDYALTLIVVFTTLDLTFTNIALSEINVALQQCIASTNPAWTLVIEYFKSGKTVHWAIMVAVSFVVVGAVLTTVFQLEPPPVWGLIAAILGVLSSASKYVFTHATFKQYKGQLGALALLFWLDILMVPILLVWVLCTGELVDIFKVGMSFPTFMQFTGTAALGGVRALTQFFMLILTSATSLAISNIFTQDLNIIISMIWQAAGVTAPLITGIAIVMLSVSSYVWLKNDKNAFCGVLSIELPCKPGQKPVPDSNA